MLPNHNNPQKRIHLFNNIHSNKILDNKNNYNNKLKD